MPVLPEGSVTLFGIYLKIQMVVVTVHFILMIWGAMYSGMMPTVYWLSNSFVILIGLWGIHCHESTDAIIMFLVFHLFTILQDIILLGIYQPRASSIENSGQRGLIDEYRFSLGMCIVNLIFKPFTAFLMWRIYQDRGGRFADLNIPGLPKFGQSEHSNYEDIDQPVPSNNVESANSLEKQPIE